MSALADFANPSTGKRNEPEKMLSGSQMYAICSTHYLLLASTGAPTANMKVRPFGVP